MVSSFNNALRNVANSAAANGITPYGDVGDYQSGWMPGAATFVGGTGTGYAGIAEPTLSQQLGIGGLPSRGMTMGINRFGDARSTYEGVLAGIPKPPDYATEFINAGNGVFGSLVMPATAPVWSPVGQVAAQGAEQPHSNMSAEMGEDHDVDEHEGHVKDEDVKAAAAGLIGDKHGLSQTEADEVVAKARQASGGDKAKFDQIMRDFDAVGRRTPPQEELDKASTPEAKQALRDKYEADYQRKYGMWRARDIGGLSEKQAADFVDHALLAPGSVSGATSGKVSIVRDKGGAPDAGKRYKVTEAEEGSGLKKGDFVFFKDGKWSKDGTEISGLPPPSTGNAGEKLDGVVASPKKQDGPLPADDYIAVNRDTPASKEIDNVRYEIFTADPETGYGLLAATVESSKVAYDPRSEKWFGYFPDNAAGSQITDIPTQPRYDPIRGRLVFKAAERGKPAKVYDDMHALNSRIDEELATYRKGAAKAEAEQAAVDAKAIEMFKEGFGKDGSPLADLKKVFNVTTTGKRIELIKKDEPTTDGRGPPTSKSDLLQALDTAALNSLFSNLPPDATVVLNGVRIDTSRDVKEQLISALGAN